MEGSNRPPAHPLPAPSSPSPPPPASPSPSFAADLVGSENSPNPSLSLFHSVFPPPSAVMGKNSSRSDIFGSSGKDAALDHTDQVSQNDASDGKSESNVEGDKSAAYEQVKIDPCSLSSSLYYGGREVYSNSSGSCDFKDDDKTDREDDSNNPNAVSRGNWWQGSLYY